MDKTFKILLITIVALIILVPVGLLAGVLGNGIAYGEWGPDDLQQMLGFIPSGLNSLSNLWNPPLPDYDLPGGHDTLFMQAPGYWISAIVGVAVVGGLAYLAGKVLIRNKA